LYYQIKDQQLTKLKKALPLFVLLMTAQMQALAQAITQVRFSGYEAETFKEYVQTKSGWDNNILTYHPIYFDARRDTAQGVIVLDRTSKTFKVLWLNGNEWNYNYTDSQTEKHKWIKNRGCGKKLTFTSYTGTDDLGNDFELAISNWDLTGCHILIKMNNEPDSLFGVKVWHYLYTFDTSGICPE
jgi:hypothetical protein